MKPVFKPESSMEHSLAHAILLLTSELQAWREQRSNEQQLSLCRLEKKVDLIMSAISDFVAKQTAFNSRQSAAVDAAVASVTALSGDVQTLNDKITELQNSVGTVTPEDQALIDALVTQGEALSAKTEAVATSLAALDALTPPNVPPVTPA